MAYNGLKDQFDEIFTMCIERIEELDLEFEEFEEKLLNYRDYKVVCASKKSRIMEPDCLNKTYNVVEAVRTKELLKPAQLYNPTPVSTKMHIKKIIKGKENSQAQDPVKKFKRKLNVKKLQDDSSFLVRKCPSLLPLITTRRHITFDDLDTDDEHVKGQYPKWSFPRYYTRRMKEQIYVDWNLVEVLFSCPCLDTAGVLSIFPSTSPNNLVRNESSIWETKML